MNLIENLVIFVLLVIQTKIAILDAEKLQDFGECNAGNFGKGRYLKMEDCSFYNITSFQNDRYKTLCCPEEYVPGLSLLPRAPTCGSVLTYRIVGGVYTLIDEFPWIVRLEYTDSNNKKTYRCGGALISSRWVLTAGHCISNYTVSGGTRVTSVRLGEWNIDTNPDCDYDPRGYEDCAPPHVDVPVDLIVPHEEFERSRKFANDIALIRLAQPVEFTDFIKPICMPLDYKAATDELVNATVEIAGWGCTQQGQAHSEKKKKASFPVRAREVCEQNLNQWKISLDYTQMCTGGVPGIDTCCGDSGGPVMFETLDSHGIAYYYAAGIVSFGRRQTDQGDPSVNTHVGAFLTWILKTIHHNS